jgi:hypothetical protein
MTATRHTQLAAATCLDSGAPEESGSLAWMNEMCPWMIIILSVFLLLVTHFSFHKGSVMLAWQHPIGRELACHIMYPARVFFFQDFLMLLKWQSSLARLCQIWL